ncbi:MAG TPA: hypothetical protein VHF47_06075 [Acidimicrobiales bacterium]|nr:hypothetical protein [Acidimicrobiales bacterium]
MGTISVVVFDIAFVAVAGIVGLYLVGWPVKALVLGRAGREDDAVVTPIVGLAVVQLFSWYWASQERGLESGIRLLVAGAAIASAVIAVARLLRQRRRPTMPRWVPMTAAVLVLTGGLFTFHHGSAIVDGDFAPVSAGNNDIAAYAFVAQHLGEHGLTLDDHLANYEIAVVAKRDVFGAYAFVSAMSALTGRPTWQVILPAMLAATFLCALAAYCLVRRVAVGRATALVVALAACSTFLFVYLQVNYFLSQVLGTAAAAALLLVYADAVGAPLDRQLWRPVVLASCVSVSLLLTYPHMAFLAPPVVAAMAMVAALARARAVRSLVPPAVRLGLLVVIPLLATLALLPGRFRSSVERTLDLSDSAAGWPLPFLTPLQFLGFQRSFPRHQPAALVVGSAVLALASLWCARWLSRRRAAPTLVAAAGGVALATYLVAYLRYGYSYNQWKWGTFFAPFLVVGLAVPIVLVAGEVARHRRHARAAVPVLVATALLVVGTANARTASLGIVQVVDGSMEELGDSAAVRALPAVNIDLSPYWETMWAAYFLTEAGVGTIHPVSASYLTGSAAHAEWTLQRTDDPRPLLPGREVRPVNDDYRLVRFATSPPPEGTVYVMGDCAGLYRFAGGRWTALERTAPAGQYRFAVAFRAQPPGTREPLVARGRPGQADLLAFEHVGDGRGRFVHLHVAADPALGAELAYVPDVPMTVDLVLDEVTRTAAVVVDGRTVLNVEAELYPVGEAEPRFGVDDIGVGILPAFSGSLTPQPIPLPVCEQYRATGRLPRPAGP